MSPFTGSTAAWRSVGKKMVRCFSGTERSGTSRAVASQLQQRCSGISLWRLLFTYAKVILSEEAIGMYSFRAGNTTVLITPCVGTRGVRVASGWTGGCWSTLAAGGLAGDRLLPRASAGWVLAEHRHSLRWKTPLQHRNRKFWRLSLETQITAFCIAFL